MYEILLLCEIIITILTACHVAIGCGKKAKAASSPTNNQPAQTAASTAANDSVKSTSNPIPAFPNPSTATDPVAEKKEEGEKSLNQQFNEFSKQPDQDMRSQMV